jgi:hypothetical protein
MSIEKYKGSSLMRSQSVSGMAGKGLVAAGSGAIVLSALAALIPFVGVLGLGVILLALGAFMWE